MNSSVIVIANPAARASSAGKFRQAEDAFLRHGCTIKVFITERRGHATDLARAAADAQPRLIMAAGGDGTINEVVNGMTGSSVPLAILPLGTTNVLARELGVPQNPEGAVEIALSAEPKTVSLGRIEPSSPSGSVRYFCLMAGIGFDAQAVHDMNPAIKNFSGELAYILSGFINLVSYRPAELDVIMDGKRYHCCQVIIGKSRKYGGNFKITPGADLLKPSFQACLFQGHDRIDLLRYVASILRGTHAKLPDVLLLEGSDIEIRGEAHIQVDGDYLGRSPARLSIAENALRLIFKQT